MSGYQLPPEDRLIDLRAALKPGITRFLLSPLVPLVERLLCIDKVNLQHAKVRTDEGSENFFRQALKLVDGRYEVDREDLERIPKSGTVVVVCNHPLGGLDGIIMGCLLEAVRPDWKILANSLLCRMRGIGSYTIAVDPFGGPEAAQSNLKGLRDCFKWLREGRLLAVWPSGTVSHYIHSKHRITDPKWAENLAPIVRRSGAKVVPVYFEGRNSRLFYVLGALHPRVRTALLARELFQKRRHPIRVQVGHPISAAHIARFRNDRDLMDFLRLRTYILENRNMAERTTFRFRLKRKPGREEAIAPPVAPVSLRDELAALPADRLLVEHGVYRVYCARCDEIPMTLLEIARLREITFRAVGEGTGMSHDLDEFDQDYLHLFLWNEEESEICGAYRLGPTDEILGAKGLKGLYTTTLFRYKPGVIESLSPGLEMGRSFVVEKYQRKHASLGLIWRGIGAFLVRYPRYRTLFGPVSISNEYRNLSKNLMVMYLKQNSLDPLLAHQVQARKPPRSQYFGKLDKDSFNSAVRDIEDVSALISEIEDKEKGVPVLLRQYLKLNATVLSFNVDPDFNDCIDGLIMVDLLRTDEKVLRRYMGAEGVESFYAYHEVRAGERGAVDGRKV